MESFQHYVEFTGTLMEGVGVAIILFGARLATGWFLFAIIQQGVHGGYHSYRQVLGRAILLGLEFLVAGDIIRTVAVTPTLESVIVLAIIVIIRTFLSMTLELELEGHWPWQRGRPSRPN